jgi:predicted ribosomally synthesized peptide with nif11-like leader
MSLENVKGFIEVARSTPELQAALRDARDPADLGRIAVEAGSTRGLSFTADEFLSTVAPGGSGGGELSEDDLEGVAGGTTVSRPQGTLLSALRGLFGESTGTPSENAAASLSPSQRV